MAAGLDAHVAPRVRLGRWLWPAYGFFVVLGFAVAVPLVAVLAAHERLSLAATMLVIGLGILASYLIALLTQLITGEDKHRYLHHEIALLAVIPIGMSLFGEPSLTSLDLALMGQGTVLAFGRVGCVMAGCCHGKPARWGVRYRAAHVAAGFSPELAHVRLFPLALVECALVLVLVAVGCALILSGAGAGIAAGYYVVGYGAGRFVLEHFRGDHVNPYWRGVSNMQWTILAIVGSWVALEAAGALPFVLWHSVTLAALVVAALTRRPRAELQSPHLHEIAAIVRHLAQTGESGIQTTSLGLSVSAGSIVHEGSSMRHYTVSHANGPLTPRMAGAIAELLARLEDRPGDGNVVAGRQGVFHVLVPITPAAPARTAPA